MKNQSVGLTEKRSSKRRLIPILAGIVGLCVPLYAYALSPECEACHNQCNNNAGYYGSQCSARHAGCPPAISDCVNGMINACHSQCASSGVCQY